jgi:2-keto-4-pentenoate hydratase/2-oxohepta-3-ene-1,7-dioic acid hydratase in catechol pathway
MGARHASRPIVGFNPPKFLQRGDRVKVEIEGIGALENPVH